MEPDVPTRMLLVEDNEAVRFMLIKALTGLCDELIVVGDGPAALEELSRGQFQLLVCDIGLPGLSGDEVCRTARADSADMAIVAVSGFASQETQDRLQSIGVTFVAKPFRMRDFRDAVEKSLAK